MTPNVVLKTERLILREFEESDWEAVHFYGSDLEVVRYMPWRPNSVENTRKLIQRAIAHQRDDPRREYELAVTLRAGGGLIGGCGITMTSSQHRGAYIGYCFDKRVWGKGYATEAARAIVAFGFEHLGLRRIVATCDTENLASARVMEKIGMTREGRMREDMQIRGRRRDSFLYAILKHEWQEPDAYHTR